MLEFTDATLQAEIDSGDLVLADFWAPRCGPCRILAPVIDALSEEYAGKIKIGKLNTDLNTEVAISNNVSAIPTVLIFKDGQIVDRFLGVTPKNKLSAAIEKHLT